jgi:hypothetical protein
VSAPVRLLLMFGALLLGISSCRFMPVAQLRAVHTLSVTASRASVLVIIVDEDSRAALRATGALVAASARPREQVIILTSRGGAVLASSRAPASPTLQVPAPPAPPPSHPTSFQEARYRQAVRQYQGVVRRAWAALRRQQQQELATWAKSTVAKAEASPVLHSTQTASISVDLGLAVSELSSLRQAGVGYGAPAVIAIIGVNAATALSAPTAPASLESSTPPLVHRHEDQMDVKRGNHVSDTEVQRRVITLAKATGVRPPLTVAAGAEAGTRRSAA